MDYWPALQIVNQVAGETGQTLVPTLFNPDDLSDTQNLQLLSALQSAGNELMMYYPWEQFRKELIIQLVAGVGAYPLPHDWAYFIDQTQWDRTNHWPLLGPKSAAEWAWLKGGLLASFPRMRFRVMKNHIEFWPVPESNSEFTMSMEYMIGNWVQTTDAVEQEPNAAYIKADGDICWYHPWLLVKYTKLKWLQLKGFDQSAATADFARLYDALKGKDTGAQVLSLAPRSTPFFIGPWSVPDGNWNV